MEIGTELENRLVCLDRRMIEIETAVYGRLDRQQPGIRGELNSYGERLTRLEHATDKNTFLLRVCLLVLGVTSGGVWVPLLQGLWA